MDHWGSVMGDPLSYSGRTPVPETHAQAKLLDLIDHRLSEKDKDMLSSPLTVDEFAASIKHMKPNSSPGMDSLTAAFYQVVPMIFGECLDIAFSNHLQSGRLSQSQRQPAIALSYKKGERTCPGKYRPIALISVDLKILSKTLTLRLQLVLSKLIHSDQKTFVKGRPMHHHVPFLSDVQDLVTDLDAEAYAVFLDFEKAYDRVNWHYMFRVPEHMDCGSAFIAWVRFLYTDSEPRLMINGNFFPGLHLTREVKQGDPLSAQLFLMVIEPRENLLRTREEHGVCLTSSDTTTGVFLANDST